MQLLTILVSITCFFLLLFSMNLFFAKSGIRRQNILLSLVFFARFGQIFTAILMNSGQTNALRLFFQSFTPLYFAAPACFYLYISGFLRRKRQLTKWDWLHFIPALVAIVHVIPWPGGADFNWKAIGNQLGENGYLSLQLRSGLFPAYFHNLFRPILIIVYMCLCWRAVLTTKSHSPDLEKEEKDWLLFLLSAATFFQTAGLLPLLFRSMQIPLYNHFFIALNCSVLLLILIYALHRPRIFYGYLLIAINGEQRKTESKTDSILDQAIVLQNDDTVDGKQITLHSNRKNNIPLQQISLYSVLMKDALENEQLYLNSQLQIIDVANKINIPVHHCSFVLNKHIGKNFRDWINGYRVSHFLLHYPLQSEKMTIEAIAQESGFKNQATFYNAFKKEKGLMPKAYFQKKALEKDMEGDLLA